MSSNGKELDSLENNARGHFGTRLRVMLYQIGSYAWGMVIVCARPNGL